MLSNQTNIQAHFNWEIYCPQLTTCPTWYTFTQTLWLISLENIKCPTKKMHLFIIFFATNNFVANALVVQELISLLQLYCVPCTVPWHGIARKPWQTTGKFSSQAATALFLLIPSSSLRGVTVQHGHCCLVRQVLAQEVLNH